MAVTTRWTRVISFTVLLIAMGGSVDPLPVEAAAPRPDIVVLYMDDFSPSMARLWSSSRRTPALARFANDGIRLRASGSTPLCCPARANLLTGRYGHRNGVTRNGVGRFDPGSTVAVRLSRVGYHTAFVGKFLNGLREAAPTARSVRRYARGWDDFDVIWGNQGRYYGYTLWTRRGTAYHGRRPQDHSSRVVGLRAARHILKAPRQRPLFMVVSLYDGHEPHLPMAAFAGHPACRGSGSISDPSINERDVSDKPRYVRARPRRPRQTVSLARSCAEIMTVDWVARRIRAALARAGRLGDTLLLFTADNGRLWGEHRLSGKQFPYSTPVPMYALWPRRWGEAARTVGDPVSNVDLAPTFCRLAGCVMRGADGRNLMPLLDGSVDRLNRRFIYEEMLHPGTRKTGRPAWYGIRTTLGYSNMRWVYTEYATGERELYDLTADPHQLENLAGRPAYAQVRSELRRMLHEEVVGPRRVRFSRVRADS
jgi:arylsulfatase A-like enzyme